MSQKCVKWIGSYKIKKFLTYNTILMSNWDNPDIKGRAHVSEIKNIFCKAISHKNDDYARETFFAIAECYLIHY